MSAPRFCSAERIRFGANAARQSRALGIDLLEFFVEITKQPGIDGGWGRFRWSGALGCSKYA
jgi:hypothetical protein